MNSRLILSKRKHNHKIDDLENQIGGLWLAVFGLAVVIITTQFLHFNL